MQAKVPNLALHCLVLAAFFAVIYKIPTPTPAGSAGDGSALSAEESRELWEQAQAHDRADEHEQAVELLERLHADYPGNHTYVRRLAASYHELGRTEDEIRYWEKYMDLAPKPMSACVKLGKAYQKLGQKDEAIALYERCLEIDAANPEVLFFLGHAHERARRLEEAERAYARGHDLYPDYSDLKLGLARVFLRTDRETAARELGLEVLARNPDNVDALLVVGLAYRAFGDLERAKEHLNRGVELKDSYTDFHQVLARIAEKEGDRERALYHYRKVLEQSPGDRKIEARVARLEGREGP